MQVKIISDEPVSRNLAQGEASIACAFVQTARTADGDIFCLYRSGTGKHGPDGVLCVQRSTDGGRTWEDPLTIFNACRLQPPRTVLCGGIMAMGNTLLAAFGVIEMLNPKAYVFSKEAESFPWLIYVSRSEDKGRTWSAPMRLDTAPYTCFIGAATSPFLLNDGGFCIPVEVRTKAGPQATAGLFSQDGGKSFSKIRMLVEDKAGLLSLCDARFARLRDGTHLMHLWAFRHQTEETISVHESRSTDDGQTWSPAAPIGIQGQISRPLELPSGMLVAICNHRQRPEGNQLWWSHDQGHTWCQQPMQMWDVARSKMLGCPAANQAAVTGENVWDELQRFSFGSPDLLMATKDVVLLTYYATLGKIIHVRACRFQVVEN
ncbi:MAG: sialidase family protein [Kiritimatiellaeota bacterium]|nr:sialidase family protein [Kiritimatiellota bacterium]